MEMKRLERKAVYENRWVSLYLDRVQMPGGSVIDPYHVLEFEQDAVAALVMNEAGQVLLIEVQRYPTATTGWELPAGVMEKGETPLETARREVCEETGYLVSEPQLLYTYYPFIGMANKVYHLTRCRALQRVGDFDPGEVRSCRWFSPAELKTMLRAREICDGFTLFGLSLHFSGLFDIC